MTYDYEFSVWPAQGQETSLFDVFRNVRRMVMTFTPDEFAGFRDSLGRSGFTLREVTRVPHHEPEIVA